MKIALVTEIPEVGDELAAVVARLQADGHHVTFLIGERGELSAWLSRNRVYYFMVDFRLPDQYAHTWQAVRARYRQINELTGFFSECGFDAVINVGSSPVVELSLMASRLSGAGRCTTIEPGAVSSACGFIESCRASAPGSGRGGAFLSPLTAFFIALRTCRQGVLKQLYLPVKRLADIAGAAVLGLITLPLVVSLVLIRAMTGRGAFYAVEVVGKHNKDVRLPTFLPPGSLASGCCRSGRWTIMTWWLPCLWNVFRGEISFVGPRMLTPEEASSAGNDQLHFHLCPGLTGWCQIKSGGGATDAEQTGMDQAYMMTANPSLDLKILAGTVIKVLKGC